MSPTHQNRSECEERVVTKIRERREKGRTKYSATMERSDLSTRDWLIHAQEEAMDLAVYLERLIGETEKSVLEYAERRATEIINDTEELRNKLREERTR